MFVLALVLVDQSPSWDPSLLTRSLSRITVDEGPFCDPRLLNRLFSRCAYIGGDHFWDSRLLNIFESPHTFLDEGHF